MSKKNPIAPSGTMIIVHVVLAVVTFGFWLLPLAIHYTSALAYGRKPNPMITAFHTLVCVLTVSTWVYVLIGWYIWKYVKNH